MMWKYISISLFLCLFSWCAEAQTTKKNKPKKEKVPLNLALQGVRLGTDISSLAFMAMDVDRKRFEVATEWNLGNTFFVGLDGGYSQMRTLNVNWRLFEYINTGYYWRLGFDYNVLRKYLDKQSVFLGVRYANALFSHEMEVYHLERENGYWGSYIEDRILEKNLSWSWAEITMGVKATLWKNIVGGYTIRFQQQLNSKDGIQVLANDIPAFGKTDNKSNLVMNFHLYYQFPFSKK